MIKFRVLYHYSFLSVSIYFHILIGTGIDPFLLLNKSCLRAVSLETDSETGVCMQDVNWEMMDIKSCKGVRKVGDKRITMAVQASTNSSESSEARMAHDGCSQCLFFNV